MNERLHRYLDGELSRDELTGDDLAELASYETAIREALAHAQIREDLPDMVPVVMRRIADLGTPQTVTTAQSLKTTPVPRDPGRGWWRWLWEPRPIAVRPALAAALLALALIPLVRNTLTRESSAPQVLVQFRLDVPNARRVQLAGDFTGWQPSYTLHETKPGVWSLIVPLDAGVHDYAFIIDGGRWIPDPLAPEVDDGFGGTNSRLTVLAPVERGTT
jgi:hypothetical protein